MIDETGLGLNWINKTDFKPKKYTLDPWKFKKNKFLTKLIFLIFNIKFLSFLQKIRLKILFLIFKFFFNKKKILRKIFTKYNDIKFDLNKTYFYNHHECHALSYGYFFKNIPNKHLFFTCDGEGDNESACVYIFDKKLKKISSNSKNNSLGYLYIAFTEYLGLRANEHEFKVMGMAPYGNKNEALRINNSLKKIFYLDKEGNLKSKVASSLFKFEIANLLKNERFDNICAAIQMFTETLLIEWIEYWIKLTKINKVVLSGGVFMNIKANHMILRSKLVKKLFIVPSSSDESLIFGALWKANMESSIKTKEITNLYLGSSYIEDIDSYIKKLSKNFKIKKFQNYQKLNKFVAELLKKNHIIARCCGREEWGARSLGNRSILCNPSSIKNINKINYTIKSRDFWMPFSPTILGESKNLYVKNLKNFNLKYMTMALNTKPKAKNDLAAALHPMDNTVRPQVLNKKDNPSYYDLIYKFKKITGIGALLNTSFNLHGEPNVSSFDDAIHTVTKSNLKYLILENYLIIKK